MTHLVQVSGLSAHYHGTEDLSPHRLASALGAARGLSVLRRDLTAPPTSPGFGDRYLVAADPTGSWAGWDDHIAVWVGDVWAFVDFENGMEVWDADAGERVRYSGGAWAAITGGSGAPTTAPYVTSATDAGLSAERVLTDTATVTWDFATPGQAKATAAGGSGASMDDVLSIEAFL